MEYVWKSSLWFGIFQRATQRPRTLLTGNTVHRAGAAVVSTITSKRDIEVWTDSAYSSFFSDLTVVFSKLEPLNSVSDHIFRAWKPWKENAGVYFRKGLCNWETNSIFKVDWADPFSFGTYCSTLHSMGFLSFRRRRLSRETSLAAGEEQRETAVSACYGQDCTHNIAHQSFINVSLLYCDIWTSLRWNNSPLLRAT